MKKKVNDADKNDKKKSKEEEMPPTADAKKAPATEGVSKSAL